MSQPTIGESHLSIPDGYAIVTDLTGRPCLVPHFLIPATLQAFESFQVKADLNVISRPGGVSMSPSVFSMMLNRNCSLKIRMPLCLTHVYRRMSSSACPLTRYVIIPLLGIILCDPFWNSE